MTGYLACQIGHKLVNNPYKLFTEPWEEWRRGWRKAWLYNPPSSEFTNLIEFMTHETYDKATVLRKKIQACKFSQLAVRDTPSDLEAFSNFVKKSIRLLGSLSERKDAEYLILYLNSLDEDQRKDVSSILDDYYTKRLTALESQFSYL